MTAAQAARSASKLYAGKVLTLAGTALVLSYGAALAWTFWILVGERSPGAEKAALGLGLALLHSAQRVAFGEVGVLSVLGGMLLLFSPLLLIALGAALLRQSAALAVPVQLDGPRQLSVRNGGVE